MTPKIDNKHFKMIHDHCNSIMCLNCVSHMHYQHCRSIIWFQRTFCWCLDGHKMTKNIVVYICIRIRSSLIGILGNRYFFMITVRSWQVSTKYVFDVLWCRIVIWGHHIQVGRVARVIIFLETCGSGGYQANTHPQMHSPTHEIPVVRHRYRICCQFPARTTRTLERSCSWCTRCRTDDISTVSTKCRRQKCWCSHWEGTYTGGFCINGFSQNTARATIYVHNLSSQQLVWHLG